MKGEPMKDIAARELKGHNILAEMCIRDRIPDEILNKPGRLTQEEYLIMKSHATLSYQIIGERWDISAHIKEAVLHHHENVDGSGYPDGLEGAQQTMFTRIPVSYTHLCRMCDSAVFRVLGSVGADCYRCG